ncbi:MAG: hypothetical protein ABSH00_03045 [Bryobacteraceae bacterium]
MGADRNDKPLKVCTIGTDRVGRQAFFHAAIVEKRARMAFQSGRFPRQRFYHRANDTISAEMIET